MIDEKLEYTISEMYRLAHQYRDDLKPIRLRTVNEVFNYVKNIPYMRDVDFCGEDECLRRPMFAFKNADCDDKSIVAGAALTNIGIPWRFITVSYKPNREHQHVYLEVFYQGKWRPFDPTYSVNEIFTEKNYTDKIIWSNHMNKKSVLGVTTLEGNLGFDPITIAAAVSAASGAANVIGDALKSIGSFFGIKGKTQHISYEQAASIGIKYREEMMKLYDALDDQGKKFFADYTLSFLDDYLLPRLGSGWGGILNREWTARRKMAYWNDERQRTHYIIQVNLAIIAQAVPASDVGPDCQKYFFVPFKGFVLDPVSQYVSQKYKVDVSELLIKKEEIELIKDKIPDDVFAAVKSNPLLIAGLLGGAALIFFGAKRR